MLVKVEGLYIPADFIILDTGKDEDESIILGRPFLATARAMIDVNRGELVLQFNEDSLEFKTQGHPSVNMEKRHSKLLSKQMFRALLRLPNTKLRVWLWPPNTKLRV